MEAVVYSNGCFKLYCLNHVGIAYFGPPTTSHTLPVILRALIDLSTRRTLPTRRVRVNCKICRGSPTLDLCVMFHQLFRYITCDLMLALLFWSSNH